MEIIVLCSYNICFNGQYCAVNKVFAFAKIHIFLKYASDFEGKEDNNEKYLKLNKYEDCSYDFDHDDVEETVTLYTSAEKDSHGDFMWDDSQDWILAVEGNNGNYTLYEEHARGQLELFVSEYYEKDGERPAIRLMISTSAGFEIREYTYGNESFREETVYNAGDINELSVNKY